MEGKLSPRVFALHHEEALTVDAFTGMLLVASHPACALIDTGATHTYMLEEFMNECELMPELLSDSIMYVNTPLGQGSSMSRVVKSVDVIVQNVSLPIDMLVLPMSDFDIVLGINWLNKYHVVIDCSHAILSCEVNGARITHELMSLRPTHMPTMELWERPMLAAIKLKPVGCLWSSVLW